MCYIIAHRFLAPLLRPERQAPCPRWPGRPRARVGCGAGDPVSLLHEEPEGRRRTDVVFGLGAFGDGDRAELGGERANGTGYGSFRRLPSDARDEVAVELDDV